jgi:RNA polymerase sigma factor (sigma-70 family)
MSELTASPFANAFHSGAFQAPSTGQLSGLLLSGLDRLSSPVGQKNRRPYQATSQAASQDIGAVEREGHPERFGLGTPSDLRPTADTVSREAIPQHSLLPSGRKPASWDGERMSEDAIQLDGSRHAEDDRLVARAQKGDAAAFDQLVGRHTPRLYGLVYHMTGNHEDTNDLLQDVWTKVFRSLAGFRGASRFTTWIHSIAVNMSINFLKRRNRRQTVSLDAGAEEGGAPDAMENLLVSPHTPRTEAGISELQGRLSDALGRLSAEHRAVVTMFDIQGMAHAEIGKVLGVSEGTVRSRLFYAHRQLQAFLSDLHLEGAVV